MKSYCSVEPKNRRAQTLAPVAEFVTSETWIFFAQLAKNNEQRENNRRNRKKE
jgi:hypothetical protein